MSVRRRALLACAPVLLCTITAVALLLPARNGAARADRWGALRDAPLERTEVAAARVGSFVYVVGGFESSAAATTAGVERYDLRRDRWKRVRDMPLALNHPTAVSYRGRVYVHGGYTSATGLQQPTGALLRYEPQRDRWRRLAPSATPRAAHAAAVIGDRLYVAGGANNSGSLRSLEVYSFSGDRWKEGPSFPGPARNHTGGVATGGRFYILAGRDGDNLAAAERYDPRRRSWEELPRLRTARGGIAAVRLRDGRIVVFGGEELTPGGETIAAVELFDPRTRRWRSLPDMRTPRHGLGGVALGRRVYAIEGGTSPGLFFSQAIEYLDVPRRR
jgi:N-acetylneuraminic acid mutarotase